VLCIADIVQGAKPCHMKSVWEKRVIHTATIHDSLSSFVNLVEEVSCIGGVMYGVAHSFSDPQVVGSNRENGYFRSTHMGISLQHAEITAVVPTGHDSVRCLVACCGA